MIEFIKKYYSIGAGSSGYTEPSAKGAGALFFVNNGLSLSTVAANTGVLGQDLGQAGNPAQLISSREIPMQGFNLLFSGMLNGGAGGQFILKKTTTGADNVRLPWIVWQDSLGNVASELRIYGTDNIFFGTGAGIATVNPDFNIGIGNATLAALTSQNNNICIGVNAGQNVVSSSNIIIGVAAGRFSTLGPNLAVGTAALNKNSTGIHNTIVGNNALSESTVATSNPANCVAIGDGAMQQGNHGNGHIAIGFNALQQTSNAGTNMTAIGTSIFSGGGLAGSDGVFLGANISASGGGTAVGNNCIFIGANCVITGGASLTNLTMLGQGMSHNISNVAIIGRADQNVIIGSTTGAVNNGAKLQVIGAIRTAGAAPLTAGSLPWDMGTVVAAASVLNAAQYLEVSVNGVLVKICIN